MANKNLGQAPLSKREEDRVRVDAARQERGPAGGPDRRVRAVVYTVATSPENGEEVTFVPGEILPDWAVQALDTGRFERDTSGVTRLRLPEATS